MSRCSPKSSTLRPAALAPTFPAEPWSPSLESGRLGRQLSVIFHPANGKLGAVHSQRCLIAEGSMLSRVQALGMSGVIAYGILNTIW